MNPQNITTLSLLDVDNSTQASTWHSDDGRENSESSAALMWLYFAVRILWGGLAIFGNSLTILVVVKFERLQTCTNYLVCSLASSDLIAAVIVPLMIVHEIWPNSRFFVTLCLSEKALNLLSTASNMVMILCLSIDRYIYIAHPLRYQSLVTPQRAFLIIGLTWSFACTSISIIIFSANHLEVGMPCKYNIFLNKWVQRYYMGPQFLLLVVSTICFHLAIAKIAHGQARAIAAQPQPYETMETAISQNTRKISRTLGLILGMYLLCFIPQFIMASLTHTRGKHMLPLERYSIVLYWANSWVNPLIYAWRFKNFKIAFKKLLTGTGSFNEVV